MSSSGKLVIGLVLLGAHGLNYFLYDRPRRKKLIASFISDHRMDARFVPASASYSGQLRAQEPSWVLYSWLTLWTFLAVLAIWEAVVQLREASDASQGLSLSSAFLFLGGGILICLTAILFGAWWFKRGQPVPLPGVTELRFDRNRITKVMASGECQELAFESGLEIYLGIEEKTKGVFHNLEGFAPFLRVVASSGELVLPASFVGVGEFLAHARHAGAKVGFAEGCPEWLSLKMQSLPAWQPGFFDAPTELCCQGCGGTARYESGLTVYACQYCGSGNLAKVASSL